MHTHPPFQGSTPGEQEHPGSGKQPVQGRGWSAIEEHTPCFCFKIGFLCAALGGHEFKYRPASASLSARIECVCHLPPKGPYINMWSVSLFLLSHLLLQKTWVLLPAPIRCLTTIHNSSSRDSEALFRPSQAQTSHSVHKHTQAKHSHT